MPPEELSPALKRPPFLIVWGGPGTGKSTEVALSFPGYVWMETSDTILRPYESYMKVHPEMNLRRPKSILISKTKLTASGELEEVDVWSQIESFFRTFAAKKAAGKAPFKGIAVDEWSTACAWMYEQMSEDGDKKFRGRNGQVDQFAIIRAFKKRHAWFKQWVQATGCGLVLVSHGREVAYHEDQPGRIKYKAGPNFPIGTVIEPVCAEADIVVELCAESGITNAEDSPRYYLTQTTDKDTRKFRDFRIKAREPVEGPGKLREMLTRAEYDL